MALVTNMLCVRFMLSKIVHENPWPTGRYLLLSDVPLPFELLPEIVHEKVALSERLLRNVQFLKKCEISILLFQITAKYYLKIELGLFKHPKRHDPPLQAWSCWKHTHEIYIVSRGRIL